VWKIKVFKKGGIIVVFFAPKMNEHSFLRIEIEEGD
jgi:hypothetical protein